MKPDLSSADKAAQSLLGWEIVSSTPAGVTSGYIVETEAYSQDDPASHTYGGRTKRNDAMFRKAGTVYVYFTYGMHYCVNIVSGGAGEGQAVLIRALEPTDGIEIMRMRRQKSGLIELANGPAKLVEAMGITMKDYGDNVFTSKSLYLEKGIAPTTIVQTTRIGIKKAADARRRYYIENNPFVSRKAIV